MMRIDNLLAASSAPTENTDGVNKGKSTRNEFLKLLVAQLERQNPLDPQSGAEFVAQLAQFTAVEQGAESNRLLTAIQTEQVQASHLAIAGFAGKSVVVSASTFEIGERGGQVPDLSVKLDGPASEVELVVTNAAGEAVRTIAIGPSGKGDVSAAWDGKNNQGVTVDPGTYHIKVSAKAKDGSKVEAQASMAGVIDAVEFHKGVPRLRIGGAILSPGSVISISGEANVNLDQSVHRNEWTQRARKRD